MLEALELKDGRHSLMVDGSQMMVLTDAPSKQPELEFGVINIASKQGVCIHFFISEIGGGNALADGIFERIANKTHGNVFSELRHWEIASFVAAYHKNRCRFLEYDDLRDKRSILSTCKVFTVSRLAVSLRLSIHAHTGSLLTITRPNGTQFPITTGDNDLALFNEIKPSYGSWNICSSDSFIDVNDISTFQIDTTVLYYGSRNSTSSIVPPACKSCNNNKI